MPSKGFSYKVFFLWPTTQCKVVTLCQHTHLETLLPFTKQLTLAGHKTAPHPMNTSDSIKLLHLSVKNAQFKIP